MRAVAFLNVDVPWIAWLVYRGEMVSRRAAGERVLSAWHAKYLSGANDPDRVNYYRREQWIERVRAETVPTAVSRLSGLYLFEDVDTARRAGQRWDGGFREEHLAEVELTDVSALSKYDSEWITQDMTATDTSWTSSYLEGRPRGACPLWELLFEGRGLILGTDVRQKAYETVKRQWPRSLGLLELSRVAVELGSDLGMITPIATQVGTSTDLRFYMNFRDGDSLDFLAKLAAFTGPRNAVDLNVGVDLVAPDLSDYFVSFSASALGSGCA